MKEGWTYKRLGDLCRIRTGKLDANAADDDGLYPFFTCSVTPLRINKYAYDCECVLVAGNGDLNVKYYSGKFNAYQRTYIIESNDKNVLDVRYLYMFLSEYVTILRKKSIGAIIKYIKLGYLTEAKLLLPPISEQQSIFEYLDSAFAKIDAMKANAEKSLNESKALFQASLKEMLEPKEGWEEKKLNDIAEYSIGLTYKPTDVCKDGTIVLRSSNIQDGKLDLNDIVRVNANIKDKLYVRCGDILMCSRNGSARLVGKVCMIPELKERMTYGTFMMVIRSVYNPLLYHYFDTGLFRSQIKHGEANMINQITRYMLDEVKLNLPPITEQQRIVATLDSLKSKVDRLQANFEKISQECDALKQAILRQVFE